jgi:hypothetical protein
MIPSAAATHGLARHRGGATLMVILAFTIVGCAASPSANPSPTSAGTDEAAASVAPSLSGRAPCPYGPERAGTCLGVLSAGTYSTTSFIPSITYTVPDDGWSNGEDRVGIFVLLAPGESFAGVEADASDWIGVFRSVGAASAGCDEEVEPGVVSAQALTDWFTRQPGLVVTEPQPTSVGGLSGSMIDLSLAPNWTGTCPFIPDIPLLNLLMGTGPSEGLGVLVEASWTTRLYLLDFEDDNIAIYVMDHPGRFSLDDYDAVVRTIQFDLGS